MQLSDRAMEVWYPAQLPTEPEADEGSSSAATPWATYDVRDFISGFFDQLVPASVSAQYTTAARRDLPAAVDGPFPLVLFAHGFASFRLQSTFLTTHLASWGFVVIAPDFLDRGLRAVLGEPPSRTRSDLDVVDEAIKVARSLTEEPTGALAGVIDTSRVFPLGHSAGGATAIALLSRDDVPSAIPLASGYLISAGLQQRMSLDLHKPVMWIGGLDDGIVPIDDIRLGFQQSTGERKLVQLDRAGHLNAFSDICEIGDGGVVALARATRLPLPEFLLQLGNDGCPTPRYGPSTELWPEVRHLVTAELRYRSGLDPEPVGLGTQIVDAFDDVASYRHDP